MDALDAGADDMQADDEVFEVYTDPDAFNAVVGRPGGQGLHLPGGGRADGAPELCEAHR